MRLLLLLCVLWIGCGKSDSSRQNSRAATNSVGATGANSEAQIATELAGLTQKVRRYGMEQQRAPKSLDELVAAGYLKEVPQPPDNKKFAINKNLEVYLAPK
jgi:competence protein ComGC